jgi:hypothetical protein
MHGHGFTNRDYLQIENIKDLSNEKKKILHVVVVEPLLTYVNKRPKPPRIQSYLSNIINRATATNAGRTNAGRE